MMDVFELVFNEDSDNGVEVISFVDDPAIEVGWVSLSKQEKQDIVKLAVENEDKRIVIGPVLIPNILIDRYDEKTKTKYGIYLKQDTINKLAEDYMLNKRLANVDVDHDGNLIEGVSIIESWVIEDKQYDKANKYKFSLPEGTWMAKFKVNNDQIWKQVKDGKIKGFSIEGKLTAKLDVDKSIRNKFSKENETFKNMKQTDKIKSLLTLLNAELTSNTELAEDKPKAKEEKMETVEEKEEKVEMETVALPDGGEIFIPEDVDEFMQEVEAFGKTFIVHVYEKTEEVEDPAETGEDVENIDEEVDEGEMLKKANEKLSTQILELSKKVEQYEKTVDPVKLEKEEAGNFTDKQGEVDVQAIMKFANLNKKSK